MFGRVEFRGAERKMFEIPTNIDVEEGKYVICQHDQGLDIGILLKIFPYEFEKSVGKIIRKATDDDIRLKKSNEMKEKDAYEPTLKFIKENGLNIKLVDIEIHFDGQHITFYFISEKRVDFRNLVKQLASFFHARIQMKQIGVRDYAKRLGGFGACGEELCCRRFLKDFEAITLQTLKDQGLSVTPQKVSGMCGRLMCCLMYEMDFYEDVYKRFPPINSNVVTTLGEGKIVKLDIYNDLVTIQYKDVEENGGLITHTLEEFNKIKKKKWKFVTNLNKTKED
ncbi:MAG: regulatory iron-sulfur-containing complex subunit RicT [candidate division WOR-3 bacterium]